MQINSKRIVRIFVSNKFCCLSYCMITEKKGGQGKSNLNSLLDVIVNWELEFNTNESDVCSMFE